MPDINKILIVEDEAINALAIRYMLSKAGFSVSNTVATGQEAIENVMTNKPDLILMDIRLAGDIDGIEAAAIIKEKVNVPVIFMTAYAEASVENKARALNPLGFLRKPIDALEIKNLIFSVNQAGK
jgi:CheY-like chemotaxis protein